MLGGKAFLSGQRLPSCGHAPVTASRTPQGCRLQVTARAGLPGIGMVGTKAGMTSVYSDDGLCSAATVIGLDEGNIVTQIKTDDTDGYNAVQVGYQITKEHRITKPELNHLRKCGAPAMKRLTEFKIKGVEEYQPGQELKVEEIFKVGDFVDVAGTTIGKGFQGAIRRWGHRRGPMAHGSKSHRLRGSIGASASPARVFPGIEMAGHMGNERKKIRKLKVLHIDPELKAIVVKGAIPGKPGNIVEITPAKIVGKNC